MKRRFRPPVVRSGRHVRRVPLGLEHLPHLGAAADDPEIGRHTRGGDRRGKERRRGRIEEFLARQAAGSDLPFADLEAGSGRRVGATGFMRIERADPYVEIGGTWCARDRWRTAVNAESDLLLGYAFEEEGTHRVELRTDERNERSERAIERLGARREGVLRKHLRRPDGSYRTPVYHGVLAPEWPGVKARPTAALERAAARPSSG